MHAGSSPNIKIGVWLRHSKANICLCCPSLSATKHPIWSVTLITCWILYTLWFHILWIFSRIWHLVKLLWNPMFWPHNLPVHCNQVQDVLLSLSWWLGFRSFYTAAFTTRKSVYVCKQHIFPPGSLTPQDCFTCLSWNVPWGDNVAAGAKPMSFQHWAELQLPGLWSVQGRIKATWVP